MPSGSWKTAAFRGPKVTTLIEGTYRRERHRKDTVGVPASENSFTK